MKIGQIKTCKKYNQEQLSEYYKAEQPKNLCCYVWLNNKGNFKNYGYVGKLKENSVIWRENKKEVIAEFKKEGLIK